MKVQKRRFTPLVLLLALLLLCSGFPFAALQPAQAATGNLADAAVAFIKADYQSSGVSDGLGYTYSFDAYILNQAGVDTSGWKHAGTTLHDAVTALSDSHMKNGNTAPVKYLAQDLLPMQIYGDTGRFGQLLAKLQSRQNDKGVFKDDDNIYSVIPAYEALAMVSSGDKAKAEAYLLANQQANGEWADFMSTAEAMRTLLLMEPGAAADSAVGKAIAKGTEWIKAQQKEDGRFVVGSMDDPVIDTAEAIVTAKALGLEADSWKTGGKSAVDWLNANAVKSDGSFGGVGNVMDASWTLWACNVMGIHPSGVNVAVSGVKLGKTSLTLVKGFSTTLTATVSPTYAGDKSVTWKSSSSKVAKVDSKGKVTGVASGKATVTVTTKDGGKTAKCAVTVKTIANPKIKSPGNGKTYKLASIKVSWGKVSGAGGYQYAVTDLSSKPNKKILSNKYTTGASFTISKKLLKHGHRYKILLQSCAAKGKPVGSGATVTIKIK